MVNRLSDSTSSLFSYKIVKLPSHPVRTGQARRGFPERKYRFNCAPSCLPVGRDPAYPALAGRGTCWPMG